MYRVWIQGRFYKPSLDPFFEGRLKVQMEKERVERQQLEKEEKEKE